MRKEIGTTEEQSMPVEREEKNQKSRAIEKKREKQTYLRHLNKKREEVCRNRVDEQIFEWQEKHGRAGSIKAVWAYRETSLITLPRHWAVIY